MRLNWTRIAEYSLEDTQSKRRYKTMTMNEYQTEAMRTASGVTAASDENLMLNGAMGLNG